MRLTGRSQRCSAEASLSAPFSCRVLLAPQAFAGELSGLSRTCKRSGEDTHSSRSPSLVSMDALGLTRRRHEHTHAHTHTHTDKHAVRWLWPHPAKVGAWLLYAAATVFFPYLPRAMALAARVQTQRHKCPRMSGDDNDVACSDGHCEAPGPDRPEKSLASKNLGIVPLRTGSCLPSFPTAPHTVRWTSGILHDTWCNISRYRT